MYGIKVINIFFLPKTDGTEMMTHKYFVLVRKQKRRQKEVNNCYTYQRTKGQNMVNYQLRYDLRVDCPKDKSLPSKYSVLSYIIV